MAKLIVPSFQFKRVLKAISVVAHQSVSSTGIYVKTQPGVLTLGSLIPHVRFHMQAETNRNCEVSESLVNLKELARLTNVPDQPLVITIAGDVLSVSGDDFSESISVENYLATETAPTSSKQLSIEDQGLILGAQAIGMIGSLLPVINPNDLRDVFIGVRVENDKNNLRLTATNGMQLRSERMESGSPVTLAFTLPLSLARLVSMAHEQDAHLQITTQPLPEDPDRSRVLVSGKFAAGVQVEAHDREPVGQYPNYELIFERQSKSGALRVEAGKLLSAVQRARKLTGQDRVILEFGSTGITLRSLPQNHFAHYKRTGLGSDVTEAFTPTGFNTDHLVNVLKTLPKSQVVEFTPFEKSIPPGNSPYPQMRIVGSGSRVAFGPVDITEY